MRRPDAPTPSRQLPKYPRARPALRGWSRIRRMESARRDLMRCPALASNRQELPENPSCLRGVLFGKKMTSLHGLPLYIVSPFPPDSQRTAILFVEGIEWSGGSPQMQHRTGDTPGCFPIFLVMFNIQGRSRAIFLADRVYPR